MMDGLLDAPSPEPQSAPEPPAEPESVVEETPAPEEEAPVEEVLPADEDGETDEEFVDDAGRKRYHVAPERMKAFVNAKNYFRAVEDFAPTIEAAKANYEGASDFRALQGEFASAEPQAIGKFMDYWQQGAPEAFGAMAQSLPVYLANRAAQNDPVALQALNNIENQVHQATIGRLYDKAQSTKDPKDLYAAQSIDFAINGRYHAALDKIPQRAQSAPQDQMRQREQAHERSVSQFAQQRWQEFDANYLTGARESSLTAAVDTLFKVAESSPAFTKPMLAAAKREAIAQAKDALAKQFEWNRNQQVETSDIQRDLVKAIRTGSTTNLEPRAAALVQEYKARINRILPGIVKPLIGDATKGVMQQSAAAHERAATGAKKIAPGAGGKPAPRNVIPVPNWKTASEGLDALLG